MSFFMILENRRVIEAVLFERIDLIKITNRGISTIGIIKRLASAV